MRYIFFDFETSDLNKLGQILNFSFIATDERFEIVDEISERIRIEKTILPRARAILANKIDVLVHQKEATLSESEAVDRIHSFLTEQIKAAGDYQVCLLGYNTARFDMKYLHTTFIRNGVNPYGKYVTHDLFFAAQKLFYSNKSFRSKLEKYAKKNERSVSLSLQAIAQAYGLLDGEQDHESRSDVLLTINVAHLLAELGCDIREYVPFEPGRNLKEGMLLWKVSSWPNPESALKPYVLLSDNKRNSLWGDLEHAKELSDAGDDLKGSIRYVKHSDLFLLANDEGEEPKPELVKELLSKYRGISLSQFFDETTCDIEEHIYRISPGEISKLRPVLEKKEGSKGLPADPRALFVRYRLRNYEWGGKHDGQVLAQLKTFSEERYGGECELSNGEMLPSYKELRDEIVAAKKESSKSADKELMDSLITFYDESKIAEALQ